MNHYEALGVAPDAITPDIRRAYLAAARRYHPDFHADAPDATRSANARRMQELNEAWEVLADDASRAAYDRSLLSATDPGVARRVAREPGAPAVPDGKGWTPRAGDDGWMTDFDGWASERDDLAPEPPRSARRKVVTLLPVALFAAAIGLVFIGLAMGADALVALGAVCLIFSGGLFVMLPMFEMARGNRR